MNIFEILNNIYTNPRSKWIDELEDSEVVPFLINNWLSMNNQNVAICKYLDRYTFVLPVKKWLHLVWVTVPKRESVPFVKYIKKVDEDESYPELMQKVKTFLGVSGNDLEEFNKRVRPVVEQDLSKYMKFFGMEKKFWKSYGLDYNDMKVEDFKRDVKKGLDLWM